MGEALLGVSLVVVALTILWESLVKALSETGAILSREKPAKSLRIHWLGKSII